MIQKLMVPSPLRPQTTMAIEKLNMAAKEAQPNVNSMALNQNVVQILPTVMRLLPKQVATVMTNASPGSAALLDRQTTTKRYPQARVIVLDDDVNTFQHVVDCLRRIIPGMSEEKAWALANRIDGQGSAEVWCGPLEQAELYHQQLTAQGLTMAPLERC